MTAFLLSNGNYSKKKWRATINESFPGSQLFNGQSLQWINFEEIFTMSKMAVGIFV